LIRPAWLLVPALLALAASGAGFSEASFTADSHNPANGVGAHPDWAAPAASDSIIAKAAGGSTGQIKQGASYYVYAHVSDTGNPASGIASVTADVSSITSGQTAVPLAAGSYTAGGATYNYRSAPLTANPTLSQADHPYTLALRDGAGNRRTETGYTVIVDNTAPAAFDVQTVNKTGGTAGRPELGDQVLLTYSEPIDPHSILAGWSGAATNVVVRITHGGVGNDVLTIRNAANSAQLPLGSLDLRRTDFVSVTRDFGASGTRSQMTQSGNTITLTLGTASGTTTTAAGTASMVWTPAASATDRAGNASSTAPRTETGTADRDF
jgi:hypothetical protein